MSDTTTAEATAVYVLYRTACLDLSSLPADLPVILVHNDDTLPRSSVDRSGVIHLVPPRNVGFGAGVNLALAEVTTKRVVIVNPDAELAPSHWQALAQGSPGELRTLGLDDPDGTPTSVVNVYPTPFGHLLSGYRVGRVLRRGSQLRKWASLMAGRYARTNDASLSLRSGRWPLSQRWSSGAVLSLDTARLRQVGGFDDSYFLYFEDVDLCRRLADRYPDMELVLLDGAPAKHAVGGSATPGDEVERHRLASAVRYSSRQPGAAWSITTRLLQTRQRWA